MACRPERRRSRESPRRSLRPALSCAGATAMLAGVLAAAGCGKSNLPSTGTAAAPPATRSVQAARAPARPTETVPLRRPLTAARAAAFARAVQLTAADVPGAHPAARSKTPAAREREAARCGGRTAPTIAGGRSPELQRGRGLDRESVSSSVEVLRDQRSVEKDLTYTQTGGGLRCYEQVLRRSLHEESDPNIRLLGVQVAPLHVTVPGAGPARGIRILARVAVPGAGVVVRLFVDALSIPYGPAELDLYGTSFVQPVAVRTEEQLLTLLHERARHQRL